MEQFLTFVAGTGRSYNGRVINKRQANNRSMVGTVSWMEPLPQPFHLDGAIYGETEETSKISLQRAYQSLGRRRFCLAHTEFRSLSRPRSPPRHRRPFTPTAAQKFCVLDGIHPNGIRVSERGWQYLGPP